MDEHQGDEKRRVEREALEREARDQERNLMRGAFHERAAATREYRKQVGQGCSREILRRQKQIAKGMLKAGNGLKKEKP